MVRRSSSCDITTTAASALLPANPLKSISTCDHPASSIVSCGLSAICQMYVDYRAAIHSTCIFSDADVFSRLFTSYIESEPETLASPSRLEKRELQRVYFPLQADSAISEAKRV